MMPAIGMAVSSAKLAALKNNAVQVCALPACTGPKVAMVPGELGAPTAVALTNDLVFIGTGSKIVASTIAPTDGALAIPKDFAQTPALSMTIGGAEVLWADDHGDLRGCSSQGTPCTPSRTLTTARNKPHDLVVSNGKLYWVEPTGVFRCDVVACTPEVAAKVDGAQHFALGDTAIYVTTSSSIWAAPL